MSDVSTGVESEALARVLEAIANKIGMTTKQVYELYVVSQHYQAMVIALSYTVAIILFVVSLGLVVWYDRRQGESLSDALIAGMLVASCVAAISGLICYCVGMGVLMKLWIPQYTAVKELIGDISGIFK